MLLVGLLSVACYSDVRCRTIDNWVCVSLATIAIIYQLGINESAMYLQWSLIIYYMAIVSALMAIFYWGMLGGGDIKLIAALILWFERDDIGVFLIVMTLLGGIWALIMLLFTLGCHFFRSYTTDTPSQSLSLLVSKLTIPYALPISLAAAFLLFEEFIG